jgi:hypothetical protein
MLKEIQIYNQYRARTVNSIMESERKLNENVSKQDIEKVVKSNLDKFEKKLMDYVKKQFEGKENSERMLKVAINVLVQYHKILYQRKNLWSDIKNSNY